MTAERYVQCGNCGETEVITVNDGVMYPVDQTCSTCGVYLSLSAARDTGRLFGPDYEPTDEDTIPDRLTHW